MRPSLWPVLLLPSCPCCLSGRSLCPAAAGLSLLSSALFVRWLSLPASLPLCVLVRGLLPLCFGPLVVVVGFVFVWCFWSSFVVGFVSCACCQLTKVTKVTKDC